MNLHPFPGLHHRGFTLIEMVTIIVIIGILAAAALPKFFNLSTFQERGFFDESLNALRYAQKRAVATGCSVRVWVTGNAYSLSQPGANDRSQCTSTTASHFTQAVPRPAGEGNYTGSQSGVSLSDAEVFFLPKGNAASAASLSVGSRRITVVKDTGFVYDSTP